MMCALIFKRGKKFFLSATGSICYNFVKRGFGTLFFFLFHSNASFFSSFLAEYAPRARNTAENDYCFLFSQNVWALLMKRKERREKKTDFSPQQFFWLASIWTEGEHTNTQKKEKDYNRKWQFSFCTYALYVVCNIFVHSFRWNGFERVLQIWSAKGKKCVMA